MHPSENVSYTNPSNVYRFEENDETTPLQMSNDWREPSDPCFQTIFGLKNRASQNSCIFAGRVFVVGALLTSMCWAPGAYGWTTATTVSQVVSGQALVGVGAGLTGLNSILVQAGCQHLELCDRIMTVIANMD